MGNRLSWFPFYVNDYLGGTSALLPAEHGAYLLALLAQWQSQDLQAIPDDPVRLLVICRGNDFSESVRRKFKSVKIDGQKYLRNERLAGEWGKAKNEHEARSKGGQLRAQQIAELDAQEDAQHSAQGYAPRARVDPSTTHNSQLTEHNSEFTTHNSDGGSERNGSGNGRAPTVSRSAKSARSTPPDDEWLSSVQKREVYRHLDVRRIFGKMVSWCSVRGKKPTRARLINWLNREDQPMTAGNGRAKETGEEYDKRIAELAAKRRADRENH